MIKTLLKDRFVFESKRVKDDKGYLLAPASISRIGIQQYTTHECGLDLDKPNRIVNIMRKSEDVFDTDSLAAFKTAILTNDHPTEAVDASNAKELQVGFIDGPVKTTDSTIDAELVWTDAEAIRAIDEGKEELSVGYSCDLVPEKGMFDGQPYEYIQTNILPNHVALVEKGRAGGTCSISDSAAALEALLAYKGKEKEELEDDGDREEELEDGELPVAQVESGSSDNEKVGATNRDNGDLAELKAQAELLLQKIAEIEGEEVVEEVVEEELQEHEEELHDDPDFEAPLHAYVERDNQIVKLPFEEIGDDEPWMHEDDYTAAEQAEVGSAFRKAAEMASKEAADGLGHHKEDDKHYEDGSGCLRDSAPEFMYFGDQKVVTAELSDSLLTLLTCITDLLNGKDSEIEELNNSLGQKDEELMAHKAQYDTLSGQMESMKSKQMPEELSEMVGDSGDTVFDLMDNMIEERIALIADAELLVPKFSAKGKSLAEIKREVVHNRVPHLTDEKLSNEAYIEARFDSMLEIVKSGNSSTLTAVLSDVANKETGEKKEPAPRVDLVEQARKDFAAKSKH